MNSLFSHFKQQLDRHADKELLRADDGRRLSYGDVNAVSAQMANALSDLGAEAGDRISVLVKKSPENLCLYLACLRAGFVYHPMNMAYTDAELDFFIGDAEPVVVVCDPGRHDALKALPSAGVVKHFLTLDGSGKGSLAKAAYQCASAFPTAQLADDELAALLYSSGTTGRPKGIMLTQRNLVSNTQTLVDAWGFSKNDCLLHALPIFHVHGLFVAIGCVLLSGASMRWFASFDTGQVLDAMPECTVMMGVPTYYVRLLADDRLSTDTASNIRLFVSGSAPLLEETFQAFEARTGHRILERYGMTETNMNTSNPLDGTRKPGTVGPPLPGVEVRISDDAGKPLPAGEIGNLWVRGPNVFKGYWKLPDKSAEDFDKAGFFRTGDNAIIDNEGYVSIVGREKDMVISGGLNVYPKEIELIIDTLDGVGESAVIGVPHPDFGEAVIAVIVPDTGVAPTQSNVIDACKKHLANFKVPKRVFVVEELPRNSMAKVQKNQLRNTYKSLFSEEQEL